MNGPFRASVSGETRKFISPKRAKVRRELPTFFEATPPPSRTQHADASCAVCGSTISRRGTGRPRRYCTACAPPGDKSAAMRAWRVTHPDYQPDYNTRRRAEYVPRGPVLRGYRRGAATLEIPPTSAAQRSMRHRTELLPPF